MRKPGPFHQATWLLGTVAAVVILVGASGAQAAGGALDPSFGKGGKVLTALGAKGDDTASGVVIQKDGKILVGGYRDAELGRIGALVRYTTGGRLDASFGRGGTVLNENLAYGVALQADGKIVTAGPGYSAATDSQEFEVARYTTSGKLDAGFGSAGTVVPTWAERTYPLRWRSRRTGRSSPPATAAVRTTALRSLVTRLTGSWMRASARAG
jgi:uncharacterized delta-60 repeat protein